MSLDARDYDPRFYEEARKKDLFNAVAADVRKDMQTYIETVERETKTALTSEKRNAIKAELMQDVFADIAGFISLHLIFNMPAKPKRQDALQNYDALYSKCDLRSQRQLQTGENLSAHARIANAEIQVRVAAGRSILRHLEYNLPS